MNSDSCRKVEIILGDEWTEIDFQELEEGDIFKLSNPDGELVGRFKALCDPYYSDEYEVYEIAIEEVE